jgi:anaerobic ribonucleoside-triphosphate reductase activating protein
MRVHHFLPVSYVNGPGPRFVLWVQGCSRHCSGCFNPLTHAADGGYELSVDEILRNIPFDDVGGITVSGGEPFEQPDEMALLLEILKAEKLHCLVYTGYVYEELVDMQSKIIGRCLSFIDILIDGPYQNDNPAITAWTGSGNQRILKLEKGIIKGYNMRKEAAGDGEIIIGANGGVVFTGLLDSGKLAAGEEAGDV